MRAEQITLSAPADTLLYKHTQWGSYRSFGQYWATRLLDTAPPGATVLAVLPTGGGKSLTYLLPVLEAKRAGRPHAALVITPTISLMSDMALGINEGYRREHDWDIQVKEYHALLSTEQRRLTLREFINGRVDVLLMSPEAVLSPYVLNRLEQGASSIGFLVIDEAHLVTDWGNQFRPEFQRLGYLRKRLTGVNPALRTHLMSATVTAATERFLRQSVGGNAENWRVVRDARIRMEAYIGVIDIGETRDQAREWLRQNFHSIELPALIYVTRREDADAFAGLLKQQGLRATSYHGDTDPLDRGSIVQQWRNGELDIVVGTSAFGLGIDKPNVRTVLHLCIPESLDRLYQEIGRAGRDGKECAAILASTQEDMRIADSLSLRLLTTEHLVSRWNDMLRHSHEFGWEGSDRLLLLDERTLPRYWRPELGLEKAQGHNQGWNEAALNFLQRQGFVEYRGQIVTAIQGRLARQPTDEELTEIPSLAHFLDTTAMQQGLNLGLRHLLRSGADAASLSEELESVARFEAFEGTRTYASLFRVAADFLGMSNEQRIEELDRRRSVELTVDRAGIDAAKTYARGRGKVQCRRVAFADLYGLQFSTCGKCDICGSHGWQAAEMAQPKPPEFWPFRQQASVRRSLTGDNKQLVLEPLLSVRTPAGQLRSIPQLAYQGIEQFVVPAAWDTGGLGVLHTLESVAAGLALLEWKATVAVLPSDTQSTMVDAVLSRILAVPFTHDMPLLILMSEDCPAYEALVQRIGARVHRAQDLAIDFWRDHFGREPAGSLNVELAAGWQATCYTPPEGDPRRAYWVEAP